MIDYTKEIERLQQAQASTTAAKSADPSFAQNASAPQQLGTPPTYQSNAVRVVSWGMLMPVAFLLWFAWQASGDVWDGYYLQPFQAMFLVMPLLMALGVLWTRQMVLQKMHAPEQVSVADTGQKMRDATRWLSPLIIVLMLASFGSMFALPRGLPLGKWLGRPDPSQLAYQNLPARAASVAAKSTNQGEPAKASSALLNAVMADDLNGISQAIAQGHDINTRNANGYTGLHLAATRGSIVTMQALIHAGADTNAPAPGEQGYGRTPLDSALYKDQAAAVALLLNNGARVDVADQTGWQALHYASYYKATQSMPLLIAAAQKQQAAIDARAMGRRGETALMKAAEMNHLEGIQMLVKAGASVDVLDKYGKNAIDYAEFFQRKPSSDLLCTLGAKPTAIDNNAPNREISKRSAC
jgi:ankyrin repeat protein